LLTKEQILKNLKEDPLWEPEEDATNQEWDLFEEAYEEFEAETDDQRKQKPLDSEVDEEDFTYLPEDEDDELGGVYEEDEE